MIRINLLPHRTDRLRQRRRRFYLTLAASFGAGIVMVLMAVTLVDAQMHRQEQLTGLLQAEHARLDSQLRSLTELQQRTSAMQQHLQSLEALQQQRNDAVQLLQELALQTPSGIRLRSLKQEARHITLNGSASSHQSIMQLLGNFRRHGGAFQQATLQETRIETHTANPPAMDANPGHDFVITVSQLPAAPAVNMGGALR